VGSVVTLRSPRSYSYRHIPGRSRYVSREFSVGIGKTCNESAEHLPKLDGAANIPITPCFFQVRVSDISWTGGANFTIKMSDGFTSFSYSPNDFSVEKAFWSGPLRGSRVSFTIDYTLANAPDTLSFDVNEAAIDRRAGGVLSITEQDNREHTIVAVQELPALAAASRSVAHLSLLANGLRATCTGFMISARHMMTNAHCVPDQSVCDSAYITFGYRYELDGTWADYEIFRCVRLHIPSVGPLDLAVIELNGEPGAATAWGHLVPDTAREKGLYLVQHPWGQPQQISRVDCRVATKSGVGNNPPQKTDFGHFCDTMQGSSGSPLLNESYKIVGLHHLGIERTDPAPWNEENRAVKVELIKRHMATACAADSAKCVPGWH